MVTPPGPGRRPIHVLTGFLGAGKTTLLRRLLAAAPVRIGVLVNEAAALSIDDRLLDAVTATIDERLLTLPGGCVCCDLRADLHRAVTTLLDHGCERIVLETSGLADPAPILHAIGADPLLAGRLELAGVVAVVDCLTIEGLVDRHPEARRQLDFADRVVLTRTDLAPERCATATQAIAAVAPGREIRTAVDGHLDPGWLLAADGFRTNAAHWLAAPIPDRAAHAPYTTRVVRTATPVDLDALQLWLRLATQFDGDRLLRVKGIVRDRHGARFAIQSAGRHVSPPLRLAPLPTTGPAAEVVLIDRGMPDAVATALIDALQAALAATPAVPR